MMKDVKELFIDTNILVYATSQKSPLYDQANKKLALASDTGIALIISPQIIREYLSATTRNLHNSQAYDDIIYNIQMFQNDFYIVDDNKIVVSALEKLVQAYSVSGKQVHDANIVATMQVYGIKYLLTHNICD
ncbi:MAG: PIN domain-containing protein, partial [Candidatus Eremiobacterota bacterium]